MRLLAPLFVTTLAVAHAPLVHDQNGAALRLFDSAAAATALFFVTTDCPISNFYAPEIQGICRDYRSRGVACALVYEDLTVNAVSVRKHLAEYNYGSMPA